MTYQLDLHSEMLMEQYRERRAAYEQLAQLADEALRKALDAQHVRVTTMEHRLKAEDSLAGKLELKGAKYHTLDDVTDILGMRVVTFYSADVDKVAAIVNETFEVDWSKSVDKRKLHRLDSFGYNSLHYICRLPKNIVDQPDMPILNTLPFEIQMRTALQHVWSTLDHDTGYKSDVKIPHEYQRQFNRLAGMLELIDEEFSRLRNTLTDYRRQMLALEASGQLDDVDLNADTFRHYLETRPFARLNQRIAAINQAELYPVPLMPFLRALQKLGLETLGDVNRLIEEHSDDAYRLAVAQLGTTDLDILSENIGLQNLCYVYVLKQGGGLTGLIKLLEWLKGPDPDNMKLAKELMNQAQTLPFIKDHY
ncbi:MAG: RelA/SpoT domain-containing protein [Prevotella sp.]|nr:RelA/SpoT domain-containing protein [Prevotella sp.]